MRANAVMRSHHGRVALSHVSGVLAHGIDTWGVNLDRVHVTRLDGGPGRIDGDVVHHEGFVLDAEVVEAGGHQVLIPERCVVEAASRVRNEAALCLMDSGLRAGAFTADELGRQFGLMQHWPYAQHLHVPVRMADGRAASIGESRGRWWFSRVGIPAPDLQHDVLDLDGSLIGITDWWWQQFGMFGEFDGKIKYGRLLKPGQDPGEVVFEEKRREDRIREATNATGLRLTWADYADPAQIRARFDRLARRTG
ncbi:hypothetical protein GCM10027076_29640 [Nocardioides montaniterrae]